MHLHDIRGIGSTNFRKESLSPHAIVCQSLLSGKVEINLRGENAPCRNLTPAYNQQWLRVKCLLGHASQSCRGFASTRREGVGSVKRLGYPAAAEHKVVFINRDDLTRSYGELSTLEGDPVRSSGKGSASAGTA